MIFGNQGPSGFINTTGQLGVIKCVICLIRETCNSHKCAQLRGVHLVVDSSGRQVSQPVYFDTGLGDGRMVFVLPCENKTYFGTTDTDYTGDLEHPKVTQEM